jgi:hypothetical protein
MLASRLAIALLLTIVLTTGCSTRTGQRFAVNDVPRTVTLGDRLASRSSWGGDTFAVLEESSTDSRARLFTLDAIASTYQKGDGDQAPCVELVLLAVERFDLREVKSRLRHHDPVTYQPVSYSERWTVRGCGVTHRWRVLDVPGQYVVYR